MMLRKGSFTAVHDTFIGQMTLGDSRDVANISRESETLTAVHLQNHYRGIQMNVSLNRCEITEDFVSLL